jgi:hypothetical protein
MVPDWRQTHKLRYRCSRCPALEPFVLSDLIHWQSKPRIRLTFDSPSADSSVVVRKNSSYRDALRYCVRACVSACLRPNVYVRPVHTCVYN